MAKHQYVRHTITPVQIGVNREGNVLIVEDPLGDEQSVVGCNACDKSLTEALEDPDCSGPDHVPDWVTP